MALEASNAYVTKFTDQVTEVYQPKGYLLRGLTRPPIKIEANTVKFPIVGRGEATPLQRGSRGPSMNASRTEVVTTVQDYQANDWVWETDLEKLNWDENAVVAETCGMAIGRKKDLLIINELNAAATTMVDLTGGNNANASTSPMTLVAGLSAQVLMENYNIFPSQYKVVCGMPPLAWAQLSSYKQFNDQDWVDYEGQVYKTGQRFKNWNGIYWFQLPLEYCPVYASNVGGTVGNNIVDFFMWASHGIGFADNYPLRSTVTWENLYSGWYHNNRFSAVAKTLLPQSIIRFRFGSASAITIN
jgi:hypothetical protein